MTPKLKARSLQVRLSQYDKNWNQAFLNFIDAKPTLARPDVDMLLHLLGAAKRRLRMTVRIPEADLEEHAGMARATRYAARERLDGRFFRATKDGDGFVYELIDVRTGKAFPGESGSTKGRKHQDDWGIWTEADY
jgi:hypothetical protein